MATTAQIAEQVKERLNVPDAFSQPLAAVRSWDVGYTLEQLETLRVTVMHHSREGGALTRRSQENLHKVQVGFQKKIDPAASECDGLSALVEEVSDAFLSEPFFELLPSVRVVASDIDPIADARTMQADRVYFGILTLTVREERPR